MSSLKTPYTIPPPCDHLASYKLKHGLAGFASLQDSLKVAPGGNSKISLPDSWPPSCSSCNGSRQRLYLCLCCNWVFCIDHTLSHARSFLDHEIVVDVERAELYCGSCRDQVYDPEFDRAVMRKYLREVMPRGRYGFEGIGIISERSSKRRRLVSGLDSEFSVSKQLICSGDQRAKSCYPLGLRGLNNLGNTCFMNSVLQVLLHAPPLRNYFLGDKHNREVCRKGSADRFCLLCDIDVIFSAVFLGDRSPFSPAQFLYSWWQHAANLASYEQQDAHEFFISLLDGIHEKEGKAKDHNKDGRDCSCIAHRVFSGLLRSDVTCMTCGYTSTTYDPCMDISLHMDTNNSLSADSPNKANKSSSNNSGNSTSTLIGCLDLFTRPEKLGSDQKFHCQNCQERQHSLKQLSIRRLPLVLCLHIKRFEHSLVRKASRKIDWYLQFPFSLDMGPYLSSSIVRKRFGNRIFPFEGDESEISSEFEIFAIVTHTGMLESGHYVTFVRLRNMWYKCDDSWVTEVDEKTVRASQCYMVFYVQKPLYYNANEELSCIPIYSQRDAFLPVVGCC